jgi:hypothetical protein
METLTRLKVNDRFEFPTELDMAPYTVSIDRDSKYSLVGVLVHSGTAQSGHYYSFAKSRDSARQGKWLHFNDSLVEYYDPASLPDATFGGAARQGGKLSANYSNAYMLLYASFPLYVKKSDLD